MMWLYGGKKENAPYITTNVMSTGSLALNVVNVVFKDSISTLSLQVLQDSVQALSFFKDLVVSLWKISSTNDADTQGLIFF